MSLLKVHFMLTYTQIMLLTRPIVVLEGKKHFENLQLASQTDMLLLSISSEYDVILLMGMS